MIVFSHSGNIGDLIYSLNFAKEFAAANGEFRFNFHIQTDVETTYAVAHPYGNVLITKEAAEFLRPLLEFQPYIEKVTISPELPAGAVNLSQFRKQPLYTSAGDIRYYYYTLSPNPLPKDLFVPVLFAPKDSRAAGKIIIFRSKRYHNMLINYKNLKDAAKDMIYLGTADEHEAFCREEFEVGYLKVNNALEAASLLNSAKLVIGNQTGLFAIAEQLKVPRWLESCQIMKMGNNVTFACPNVLPIGGKCRMLIDSPNLIDLSL